MTTEGVSSQPSTTLTAEDCATLRKYFALKQHEFLSGNAYITEAAITTRIEDVDPAWTFEILNISNRDAQVTALGRLTIKGVSRDGIGMAKIAMTKDGKAEANEAEKAAATDALKRAARLFGIGRYLLEMENVTNAGDLERWFARSGATELKPTPQLNVVKTDTGAKVETPLGAGEKRRVGTTPLPQVYTLALSHPDVIALYSVIDYRRNMLDQLDEYSIITPELPLATIVERIKEYHTERAVDKKAGKGYGTDKQLMAETLARLKEKYGAELKPTGS